MQDSCTVHIFYCIAKLAHCPRSIFSCQAQTEVAGTVLNNNFIFLLFTRISISSKVSWLCFISIFILAATAFTYVYKLQLQHQWKYRNWYRCRQYSACFFSIHNKLLSEPHINVKAAIFSILIILHTHTKYSFTDNPQEQTPAIQLTIFKVPVVSQCNSDVVILCTSESGNPTTDKFFDPDRTFLLKHSIYSGHTSHR